MTVQAIHAAVRPRRSHAGLAGFLESLSTSSGLGRRAALAQRLWALSDQELAARGVSRDRILHRAFGPYLHL
jgi:hypothetical protein